MRLRRRIRTQTLRQRRRQIVIEGMAYLLAIIGSVILLLSQLSMVEATAIRTVNVRGNSATPSPQLLDVVREKVRGHYLYLFSRGNILLYPRFSIEREIVKRFPRVKDVDVDVENLTTISVTVAERKEVAKYCASDTRCFLLDADGFIFAPALVASDVSASLFVYRVTEAARAIGDRVLAPDAFRSLNGFVVSARGLGIGPVELTIVGDREYRLLLRGGAEIIFDPADGYSQILENLRIVLGANELKTRLEDGRLIEVDYIDLRYGNKVFYKLERDTNTQIENE
ncbi:hypothetical protein L0Y40_01655 [Candidatus Wolfebacteria bacterium]|nr:hypothetical protein [Candidatus Wolfebacteria bacterium]